MKSTTAVKIEDSLDLTLSIAHEATQRADFHRFVFEHYLKKRWIKTDDYPLGIIADRYDEYSDVLIIRTKDEIIAGTRIVMDHGLGFPHEHELRLDRILRDTELDHPLLEVLRATPRNKMAEITRLAGKRLRRMLVFDLAKCVYWYAKLKGLHLYLMVIDFEFFQLCHNVGIPIEPIGIPVFCEGSWTVPAIMIPERFVTAIPAKSPAAWNYIMTQDNLDSSWTSH